MTTMIAAFCRVATMLLIALFLVLGASAARAISPEVVHDLALGENEEKVKAISSLVASGEPGALELLQAFVDGEVQTAGDQVLRIRSGTAIDLVTGNKVEPIPATL